MCIDVRKMCECGQSNVQFHMRDNVLMPEVIVRLYCPECPGDNVFDNASMISDNSWVIEYDMILAKMLVMQRDLVDQDEVTPEYIFDQGYATWQEMYPGEREEIRQEKDEIVALVKVDQKKYLEEIQKWNIERISKLKRLGWRKVLKA